MKTRRITLETHLHKIAEYDETVKNLESVFNIQKQKVIRCRSFHEYYFSDRKDSWTKDD